MHFDPRAGTPDEGSRLRLRGRPTDAGLFCEDRVERQTYNTLVQLGKEERAACAAAGRCPEPMQREDGAYDALVWVEHNKERAAGGGSCIFLHVERGEGVPTAGCTSAPRDALGELVGWLDLAKVPVLLQLPRAEYVARQEDWRLPPLASEDG